MSDSHRREGEAPAEPVPCVGLGGSLALPLQPERNAIVPRSNPVVGFWADRNVRPPKKQIRDED